MTISKYLLAAFAMVMLAACGSSTTMPESEPVVMAADADDDGVLDSADRCPETPTNVGVDARGCALDSDGDGAPDYADRCADTPSGAAVDEWGCSD